MPSSLLPNSLPVPITQFLQDCNCHSPCLICCPAGSSVRGFPVPPAEVPAARREDVMSHPASLVTRSFSANHSGPSAQHHHRMQPPQPIAARGQHLRLAPFHQLTASQFPDLHVSCARKMLLTESYLKVAVKWMSFVKLINMLLLLIHMTNRSSLTSL